MNTERRRNIKSQQLFFMFPVDASIVSASFSAFTALQLSLNVPKEHFVLSQFK
jgi:hypothetical protein